MAREPGDAGFSHFPHDADIGIRAWGPTLAVAFEQAASALTAAVTDPATVRPMRTVTLRCEAPTPELLLVDWLNELVFQMATRRMLFADFRVHIEDGRLAGVARGELVSRARHQPAAEVKGVTYTALEVTTQPSGRCRVQCVVDV